MSRGMKLAAIALALFGATPMMLTACGGGPECGPGTTERDGECVAQGGGEQITCGEGTRQEGDACVPDSTTEPITCADGTRQEGNTCVPTVACGEGTSPDSTGACIPTDAPITCAEGTTLQDNTCVLDPTTCAEGTTLTEGRCVADVICGPATSARDGACLTADEILKLDADVTSVEPDDALFGGTPQSITLPAASSSLIISGTIETAQDLDGDGQTNQDFDFYTFEAQAGTYLNLKALNAGAGSLAFVIEGPENYARTSPLDTVEPARQLLLPYTGTYTVQIGPKQQLLFDTNFGPQGGDGQDYALVIENLGPFDTTNATALDATTNASATGTLGDLLASTYKIQGTADTYAQLALPSLATDGAAALIFLDETGAVIDVSGVVGPQGRTRNLGTSGEVIVVVDPVQVLGDRADFTVQARAQTPTAIPGPVAGGATLEELPGTTLAPGASALFEVDFELLTDTGAAAPQGLIVLLTAPGVAMRAYGPDGKVVTAFQPFQGAQGFHARVGGKYVIEAVNTDTLRPATLGDWKLDTYVPADGGSVSAGTAGSQLTLGNVAPPRFAFFTFETTEALTLNSQLNQATAADVDMIILSENFTILDGNGGPAQNIPVDDVPLTEPGRYFGAVVSFAPPVGSTNVNVTLDGAPLTLIEEVEPNGTNATATSVPTGEIAVATLGGGPRRDLDIYKLAVSPNDTSLVSATIGLQADSGQIWAVLRDSQGTIYSRNNGTATFNLGAVVPGGEEYFVEVYRTQGFTELPYAILLNSADIVDFTPEQEPNNTAMDATLIAPQLMPSFSFATAGTLVGDADEDWFTFNVPAEGLYQVGLENIPGIPARASTIKFTLFEDDGAGNLTEVATDGPVTLTSGPKVVKVEGGTATGFSNNYVVRGIAITERNLGVLDPGVYVDETGTIQAAGAQVFKFTLDEDLASDGSETLTIWADKEIEVLDDQGNTLFAVTGTDRISPSFSTDSLLAGTYTVRVIAANGADWRLVAGIYPTLVEAEALDPIDSTNDDPTEAQDLGTLVVGTPTVIYGSVSALDEFDFFKFTIPDINGGAPVNAIVEQFQIGSAVADIDVYFTNAAGDAGDFATESMGWDTPQVVTRTVTPGEWFAMANHWSGADSGDYLIRILLLP